MLHGQNQTLRESVPVIDLKQAPRTHRTWQWVCSALVSRNKRECRMHIVDSVFVANQQLRSWYFTDDGIVRRKPRRKITADEIQSAFIQTVHKVGHGDGATRPLAVCWLENSDTSRVVSFLTAPDLLSFLQSVPSKPLCNAVISTFDQPRGGFDPSYANLEHDYSLEISGGSKSQVWWLALGERRMASKDQKLNATVNDSARRLVTCLEKNKQCRVVRCVSLFIMDDGGKLYLWRTSVCETIATTVMPPPTCSESTFSSSYAGPRAINERLVARARAIGLPAPDEDMVEAIMASPIRSSSRLSTRMTATPVSTRLDPLWNPEIGHRASIKLPRSSDWDQKLSDVQPRMSLSRRQRRMKIATCLMSDQKRGCCGDYCTMSMTELTASRMNCNEDSMTLKQADQPRKSRGWSSIEKVTATASAFMDVHRIDDISSHASEQQEPELPQRVRHTELQPLTNVIPFKLIARTRAEKKVVELFIRRYQSGQDSDDLAETFYGDDDLLDVTFPSYYYRNVQVCANCYEFYTLVDTIRTKALKQVVRRRNSRLSPVKQRRKQIQQLTIVESQENGEEGENADNIDKKEDPSDNFDRLQYIWKHLWAHTSKVAAALSKKDAAELYSFVNPHPAVAMVMSGLGALLVGSIDGSWGEVKRVISHDKLVTRLHCVDFEALAERDVMQAAAHARNPLFTPAHIAPISSCAARFCDWIRTALQAYAWNQRLQLQDSETRHMLRFLQPEILPPGVDCLQFPKAQCVAVRAAKHTTKNSSSKRLNSNICCQKQASRRAHQAHQMSRLSALTGYRDGAVKSTRDGIFTCQDGVTRMPYTVIGEPTGQSVKCNLIVFHDLFDTFESTRVFFRPIIARNVGAQALLFNFPGQAGASYIVDGHTCQEDKVVLNNMWLARRVHELLVYLQHTTQFITTGAPFHFVGFGNGANIATCYTVLYGKSYDGYLQSLALFNGFSSVDAQLAAVLHNAVNVFVCLSPTRPDLPVSFFSKYLFSDAYLRKVDVKLALSLYSAVTNPITLDGRLRLCRGALCHVDLCARLKEIDVPIVLIQSVENLLVSPSNVDPFLQGRARVLQVGSHQQSHAEAMKDSTRAQLKEALATPNSVFVSWLQAGHELRQEAKNYVSEVIEVLVNCHQGSVQYDDIDSKGSDKHFIAIEQETTAKGEAIARQFTYCEPFPIFDQIDGQATESFQILSKPSLRKPSYELQLEKSERADKDALRDHKTQSLGFKKSEKREDLENEERHCSQMDDDINSVRRAEEQRVEQEARAQRLQQRVAIEERIAMLREEQEQRRREWEQENCEQLVALEAQLQAQQAEELITSPRRKENLEQVVENFGLSALDNAKAEAFMSSSLLIPKPLTTSLMPNSITPSVEEERQGIQAQPELPSRIDRLETKEQGQKLREQERRGFQINLEAGNESHVEQETRRDRDAQATCVQKYVRRFLATCRVDQLRREKQRERLSKIAGGEIVRIARGRLGRRRFCRFMEEKKETARRSQAATLIQTVFRGYCCRITCHAMRRESKARMVQRVYRGFQGRKKVQRLREEQKLRRFCDQNAIKLQATWRMYVARSKFLTARFSELAAVEIQRVYRGVVGRQCAARKKQWHDTPSGADRLVLGLQLIEGSKQTFKRQRKELDALHSAQEEAERQVGVIHKELRDAEQEMAVLEHELQEIDQLDGDVRELTREAERLHASDVEEPLQSNCIQADKHAVEMALIIKRSEREQKKRNLEVEFAGAFAEVHRKREALAVLEKRLAAMEQTRVQKDREFGRLQRHLMELLEEQKLELENLRGKGMELETATATSAAAAAATAAKAREHEERSRAMFESTEELMKFQFMSMSLSYFSSLNMLKNLREINADTTASAITSTAETTATAAAAVAAANITPITSNPAKKSAGGDAIRSLLPTTARRKQQKMVQQQREEKEAISLARREPLPQEVHAWTVDDVGRWLDTLSLSQYKAAFREGAVDGEFLMELRAEDMAEVLGVSHKLHVRKLLAARSKLLPSTATEQSQLDAENHEANAKRVRGQEPSDEDKGSLNPSTVFSQARNGRIKRLVESLDAGFPINTEDDKGNTLLLLACQNVNQKMVEMLIGRQANVNHRNAQGNTPLHFAMAYDNVGLLGEYLIAHGADDAIENNSGLSPYDGLTAE